MISSSVRVRNRFSHSRDFLVDIDLDGPYSVITHPAQRDVVKGFYRASAY